MHGQNENEVDEIREGQWHNEGSCEARIWALRDRHLGRATSRTSDKLKLLLKSFKNIYLSHICDILDLIIP